MTAIRKCKRLDRVAFRPSFDKSGGLRDRPIPVGQAGHGKFMIKKFLELPFTNSDMPLWIYVLAMTLLAVPLSWMMLYAAVKCCTLFGLNADMFLPRFRHSRAYMLVGAGFLGPIIETMLLALGLSIISKFVKNPVAVAATSALLWGALHGLQAPLWFFGTAWSFYVFSASFMARRELSFRAAFIAAAVPHGFQNISAMVFG